MNAAKRQRSTWIIDDVEIRDMFDNGWDADEIAAHTFGSSTMHFLAQIRASLRRTAQPPLSSQPRATSDQPLVTETEESKAAAWLRYKAFDDMFNKFGK